MDWDSLPEPQRRAMRSAIVAQCFGMLTQQMLSGGILLLYLNALGVRPSRILLLLNLMPFLSSLLSIPLGWGADRVGIKKFGTWGNAGMFAGLSLVAGAASLRGQFPSLSMSAILAGLVVHTFGAALFNTGWFSLLSHLVPPSMTGRYFGVLRSTWQLVALSFFALSATAFTARTPVWIYQCVLGLGAVAVACRGRFYKTLPEVPVSEREALPLTKSVKRALALPGFAAYLAYLLLLVCVTGNGPDMLRLSAVRGVGLGDDQVLFLTVGSMSGSLLGFATAGRWVDRLGPRTLFLACHIGFAVALAFFPSRTFLHLPTLAAGLAGSFLLGLATATLGLATTAQSFRICRGTQRTIAYALVSSVQTMGSGLSGFALAAFVAHLELGGGRNPFDLVLAGLSGFVLLQIGALGLLRRPENAVTEFVVPHPVRTGSEPAGTPSNATAT